MLDTAIAIVLTGAVLAFVGTAMGLWQTRRASLGGGAPAALVNTGLVLLVGGIVAVIFGAGYLLFVVVGPG